MKKTVLLVAISMFSLAGCCAQLRQAVANHSEVLSTDVATLRLALPNLKCDPKDDQCKGSVEAIGSVAQGLETAAKTLGDAARN